MDAHLVEKITRLVLLKLEEASEYSATMERTMNPWSDQSPSTKPEVIPLTVEELKNWHTISSSMGLAKSEKPFLGENSEFIPLTEEELNKWNKITSSMEREKPVKHASAEKELDKGKVKFFPHHKNRT